MKNQHTPPVTQFVPRVSPRMWRLLRAVAWSALSFQMGLESRELTLDKDHKLEGQEIFSASQNFNHFKSLRRKYATGVAITSPVLHSRFDLKDENASMSFLAYLLALV
jgi:hypothetical protein